jgi:hypothetical protein
MNIQWNHWRRACSIFVLAIVAGSSAKADVVITTDPAGPFMLIEGQSITIKFTVTNTGSEDLISITGGITRVSNSGDTDDDAGFTDFVSGFIPDFRLNAGQSIDSSIRFTSGPEVITPGDPDFGITKYNFHVDYTPTGGKVTIWDHPFDFQVIDVGFVPEPSPLVLAMIGGLGVVGYRRWQS